MSIFILSLLLPLFCFSQKVRINNAQDEENTFTPEELVRNVLFDENCIEIENVIVYPTWNNNFGPGDNRSISYFNKANTNFPADEGIAIVSGFSKRYGNSNSSEDNISTYLDTDNDPDLDAAMVTSLGASFLESDRHDATYIQFDFKALDSQLSFTYVFASEEYTSSYPCSFSDAFALLLKKRDEPGAQYENIALLSNNDAVLVTNIVPSGYSCPMKNEQYYQDGVNDTNFNGRTVLLTASTSLVPGTWYTIKMVVSDYIDNALDTGVFINGDFDIGNPEIAPDNGLEVVNDTIYVCEGFEPFNLEITNPSPNITYKWEFEDEYIEGSFQQTTTYVDTPGTYSVLIDPCEESATSIEVVEQSISEIIITDLVQLQDCNTGQTFINLNDVKPLFVNNSSVQLYFFENQSDAQNLNYSAAISNTSNFPVNSSITLYVVAKLGVCTAQLTLELDLTLLPPVVTDYDNAIICLEDIDNSVPVDLTIYNSEMVDDISNYEFSYYFSMTDAENETNAISNPSNFVFPPNTTTFPEVIYVRVDYPNASCHTIGQITFNEGEKLTINSGENLYECAIDVVGTEYFGKAEFDLEQNENAIYNFTDATFTYYTSEEDALSKNNEIANPAQYINTVLHQQTIWVRVSDAGFCDNITSFELIVNPKPYSESLADKYSICPTNDSIVLSAGIGFDSYQWYMNGTMIDGANQSFITVEEIGNYSVDLVSSYPDGSSCINTQETIVSLTPVPEIIDIVYGNGYIELIGGIGLAPYEYNVDGGVYSPNNRFYLPSGIYEFGIRSADNCEGIPIELPVISITNTITPNDDGVNDQWEIRGFSILQEPTLDIFDKYGKKIYSFESTPEADNFVWDGKYQGRALPSSSYWYVLKFKSLSDRIFAINGYILIKNRNSEN